MAEGGCETFGPCYEIGARFVPGLRQDQDWVAPELLQGRARVEWPEYTAGPHTYHVTAQGGLRGQVLQAEVTQVHRPQPGILLGERGYAGRQQRQHPGSQQQQQQQRQKRGGDSNNSNGRREEEWWRRRQFECMFRVRCNKSREQGRKDAWK